MSGILLLHILTASTLTVGCISLLILGSIRKKIATADQATIASFIATFVSGISLIAVSGKGLTHFCATMTAYSFLTIGVRYYYLRRTKNTLSSVASDI